MEIGLHGNIELPVKCCKPDSARHSTINIIANRLMAVMGIQFSGRRHGLYPGCRGFDSCNPHR